MFSKYKVSVQYTIFFRLLEGFVFAPLAGMAGQALKGRTVVDSTALVGFFLSPRGLIALLMSGMTFLLIRMVEQAGLSLLAAGQEKTRSVQVFWKVITYFESLLRAALRFLISTVAVWLPFLILTGGVAKYLLSSHDINFYLAARPPVFMTLGGIVAAAAIATLAVYLWMIVRWRWVVHSILFENKKGKAAFERSKELVNGIWWSVAGRWAAIGILNLVLGVVAALVGRAILPAGMAILGDSNVSLGALLGVLLITQAVIGALILMTGPIIEATIFTEYYFRVSGVRPTAIINKTPSHSKLMSPMIFAGTLFILMGVGGVMGAFLTAESLSVDRPVMIITHRGGVATVPENSMIAFEMALVDGANSLETDIQLTKDGVPVLNHDRDFSRMAGVAKNVTDMTWEEMKKLEIGSPVSPSFKGTAVASLEDLILLAKRFRVRLCLEPKYYGPPTGEIEKKIVEMLQRHDMVDSTEIQSLEYDVIMNVRKLEPRIKVGYLMSVNARRPSKLDVDFLSVQAGRIDGRLIRQARRAGQRVYAWTVDSADDANRMIDMGVDGLITNQALTVSNVIRDRRSLTPREAAKRRLRAWLAT